MRIHPTHHAHSTSDARAQHNCILSAHSKSTQSAVVRGVHLFGRHIYKTRDTRTHTIDQQTSTCGHVRAGARNSRAYLFNMPPPRGKIYGNGGNVRLLHAMECERARRDVIWWAVSLINLPARRQIGARRSIYTIAVGAELCAMCILRVDAT